MEQRVARTAQSDQHKVLLRKMEFGHNCQGLVNTKDRRVPFIYSFCAMFLVKCKHNYNLVDRISELPDDILARIVSLMPLKEAAGTSVLSRRWRYVWTSTMNLHFDVDETLPNFMELEQELKDSEILKYVDWVNSVVHRHTERNIEKFRVCFNLDSSFTSSIDGWIDLAMKRRVQVLVLEFLRHTLGDIYTFPHKLLGIGEGSSLKHYTGFKTLKVLCLDHVDVTGEVLEYFMSHSPALERLSVAYTNSLFNVRIVGPSIGLKYLETKCCFRLKRVEICDTNLVSFIHIGGQMDLILNNVPMLVELSIDSFSSPTIDYMSRAFTQLSCCASQLETFMMGICGVDYSEDTAFPVFSKLKHLELTVQADYELSLSQLSSFMKACPYLERLVLKLCFQRRIFHRKLEKAAKCPHHNIKVLEVVGYRGHPNGVEQVMYLIENAVELERIVIDPVQRWIFHHTGADIRRKDRKKAAKARRHALRWLKDRVPSTIEFVCS